MRKLLALALGMAILSACQPGAAPATPADALETAVSATLSAMEAPPARVGQDAGGTPTTPSEPVPSVPPPVFGDWLLAYSSGVDLWVRVDGQPAAQIAAGGTIVSLVVSSDGQTIVYGRSDPNGENFQLRAVASDGTNDRLLMDQAAFDALHPLGNALHIRPAQTEFLGATHTLLFNTRGVFEGPGLAKYNDLLALDTDSGLLTQLLEPDLGGDFYVAPDAGRMALVKPNSIALADVDGGNRQPDIITFDSVITYSEYAYYPAPRWAPDSSRFGVIIPSADPLAADTTAGVWIAPADGSPAERMAVLNGDTFFPQAFGAPLISPELLDLTFFRSADGDNQQTLFLARVDGSDEQAYSNDAQSWAGWNPDSIRFAYRTPSNQFMLGSRGANPQLLGQGRQLQWVDADRYLLLSGQVGAWQLVLGTVSGASSQLAGSNGNSLLVDFVH